MSIQVLQLEPIVDAGPEFRSKTPDKRAILFVLGNSSALDQETRNRKKRAMVRGEVIESEDPETVPLAN
jgi:hypothetical protein